MLLPTPHLEAYGGQVHAARTCEDLMCNWPEILYACRFGGREGAHVAFDQCNPLNLEKIAPFPAPGTPYGREVLYNGPEGEAILALWRPNASCAPHDHGGSRGYLFPIKGELHEIQWKFTGSNLISLAEKAIHLTPGVMFVEDETIHSIFCREWALTLHLYYPSMTGMRVYDARRRQTVILKETCGAWVPDDETLIQAKIPWVEHLPDFPRAA